MLQPAYLILVQPHFYQEFPMPAQKGRDFLLNVWNGSAYVTVGGLRSNSLTVNNRPLDASNKGTGDWRTLLAGAGVRSLSLSASGVFEDSASEEIVRAAAFAGTTLNCQLAFGNGDRITGLFLITSYERGGDYDREETYTLGLESAGAVAYVIG
jgi:TP901-1 family phage major tail protein